jgi:hypothetical protein
VYGSVLCFKFFVCTVLCRFGVVRSSFVDLVLCVLCFIFVFAFHFFLKCSVFVAGGALPVFSWVKVGFGNYGCEIGWLWCLEMVMWCLEVVMWCFEW